MFLPGHGHVWMPPRKSKRASKETRLGRWCLFCGESHPKDKAK